MLARDMGSYPGFDAACGCEFNRRMRLYEGNARFPQRLDDAHMMDGGGEDLELGIGGRAADASLLGPPQLVQSLKASWLLPPLAMLKHALKAQHIGSKLCPKKTSRSYRLYSSVPPGQKRLYSSGGQRPCRDSDDADQG
jgi:hypothetical protein